MHDWRKKAESEGGGGLENVKGEGVSGKIKTYLLLSYTDSYYEWGVSVLNFYVTCNDISVIYMTAQMCRRSVEEVVPTVELPTP